MLQTLSINDIRRAAPAVFATAPEERVSSRYQMVSTTGALDLLRNEGYQVVEARQDRAAKRDSRTARHSLTLVHEDFLRQDLETLEYFPRVLLVNSHNRTAALSLMAGLFRLVCSNGIVVGNLTAKVRMRHIGNINDVVAEQLRRIQDDTRRVSSIIESWAKIELTAHQEQEFAKEAAAIRFGDSAQNYQPSALLEARRVEDDGRSLWQVFNRVQESAVMRGISGANANGRAIRSRALNGTTEFIRVNRALWDLAEQFATPN